MFRDPGEHSWPDLLIVVKCKDEVRPAQAAERAVGARLALEFPAGLAQSGQHPAPSPIPIGSPGLKGNVQNLGDCLAMVEAVREHPQSKRLDPRQGIRARRAIGKDAGQ